MAVEVTVLEIVREDVFVEVGDEVCVLEGVGVEVKESDPVEVAVDEAEDVMELVTDQVGVEDGL